MEGNWDLKRLYAGFWSLEYERDLKNLKKLSEKIKLSVQETTEENSAEHIKSYLKGMEDFQILYSRLYSYATFRGNANINDEEAQTQVSALEAVSGGLVYHRTLFISYLKSVPELKNLCKKDEFIGNYEYYVEKLKGEGMHQLSPEEEALLSVMTMTGSKSWGRLQNRMSAAATAEVSAMTASAAALNSIKGEVLAVSKMRHFSSPLHRSLVDYHMDEEILSCLLESVEAYLPRLCRYYKLKSRIMGFPEGLPYDQRESSMVKANMSYDIEDGKRFILSAFEGFGRKMYLFGKQAFDERWIDYLPSKDKVSGASCDGIYAIGESRIRLHYNGTLQDVNTLAHELGHGYHNLNLFEEGILNYSYDLPIAETAAKFSEILFKETLKKQQPSSENLYLDDFSVSGFVNTIVDIQSRFCFEDEFFAVRRAREPSAEEICQMMQKAQLRCYGDSLNKQHLNPYMWLNKPHYYFADRSYYNFPYSFGTLISIGMYRHYEANPQAFAKDYDVFLKSTGKMDVYNLCKIVGIDVKSRGFFRDSLEYVAGLIEDLEGRCCV